MANPTPLREPQTCEEWRETDPDGDYCPQEAMHECTDNIRRCEDCCARALKCEWD